MPCTPLFLFPPYQKPPFNVLRRWRNTKKTALIIGLPQRRDAKKTAEERFNMLARGWLAYPVTPTHHTSTAEERLYKRHPGMRQRRITPRNPIRTTRQRRAHGASAGTTSMRFGDALLPPLGAMHPHRKNRHPSARYTTIGEKTAEERFNMLARGWLAYPVTPTHHTSTAEERLYKRHPGMRQRRITPRNPIRTTRQRRAHGASAGHHLYALRRCATSPSRRGASPSKKTATHRFAYPVVVEKKTDGWDSNHRSLYRYVLLCDYLLTTRRSLIRAFLPVRLRR